MSTVKADLHQQELTHAGTRPSDWWAFTCIAIIVLVLWLPFDWKRTGTVEWWSFFEQAAFFKLQWIDRGFLINRPLWAVPYDLGVILSPRSYLGANILLCAIFFLKTALLYATAKIMVPQRRTVALAYALLVALYPADAGTFDLRNLPHHFALVPLYAGSYLFLRHWQTSRIDLFLAASALVTFSILSHPEATTLVWLVPLLAWWVNDRRISPRLLKTTGAWIAIQLVALLYVMLISSILSVETYQDHLWVWNNGLTLFKLKTLLLAPALMFLRHFVTGWLGAITSIVNDLSYTLLGTASGFVSGLVMWLYLRNERLYGKEANVRQYLALAAGGAVLMMVCFAPYWVTQYRLDGWRTYFVTSIGAAISLLAIFSLIDLITRARGRVFVGMSALAVGISVVAGLNQTRSYQDIAYAEQEFITDIIGAAPGIRQPVSIVVLPPQPEQLEIVSASPSYPHGIAEALRFVYDDPDSIEAVAICDTIEYTTCTISVDGVDVDGRISLPAGPGFEEDRHIPYERALIFAYNENGRLDLLEVLPWEGHGYDPLASIDKSGTPSANYVRMIPLASR